MKHKSKRIVTSHRDFFWPGNQELRPMHQCGKNLWIHVHDQTTGDNVYIKFTVNTDDVNGFAKHWFTTLENKQKVLDEALALADNLPNPITMDWLKANGVDYD